MTLEILHWILSVEQSNMSLNLYHCYYYNITYVIELVLLLDICLILDKKEATHRTRKENNRFILSSKNERHKAGKKFYK